MAEEDAIHVLYHVKGAWGFGSFLTVFFGTLNCDTSDFWTNDSILVCSGYEGE